MVATAIAHRRHLFPVGRLDFDSSGLVLLTNDGELAQRLSHPRYQVAKVYRVKVRGHVDEQALGRLRRGIRLADGMTSPAEVRVEQLLENKTRLEIRLHEGRQRQVRRMFEAIGHPVAGDRRYGDFAFNRELRARWGLKRLFLHAEQIEFPHPRDAKWVKVSAPLPEELEEVLERAALAPPSK